MPVSRLVKLSEAASLGLHAMGYLARNPGRPVPNREMAGAFNASTHHLAKVMQTLSKARLAKSQTGPIGGFLLARTPASIRLREIYEAIEGPLDCDGCLLEKAGCQGESCMLGEMLQSIGRQMTEFLSRTTLAEMAQRLQVARPCTTRSKA